MALPPDLIRPSDDELDHTPIGFGKYRALTPSKIAELDPKYLVWAHDTVLNRPVFMSEVLYRECIKSPDTRPQRSGFTTTQRKIPPADSIKGVRDQFDPYNPEDDRPF